MARLRQLELPAPPTWGGKRKGAGRKPARLAPGMPCRRTPHRRRPALSHRHPTHVTLRVLPHVWNLRSRRAFRAIGRAFAGNKERGGFRLVHFSVQGNHLHLIVEAPDAVGLSRGMIGLATWIARRLNQMMGRRGKVFADRFHAHVLRSPVEVARAIGYVLGNFAVHAARWAGRARRQAEQARPLGSASPAAAERIPTAGPDPYSSAGPDGPWLTAAPRTWLLCEGFRRGARGAGAPQPFPPRP